MQSIIDLLVIYAFSFVGTPYKWGGDNPMDGFDCSGLVVEILKSSGFIRYNADLSGQELYDLLIAKNIGIQIPKPQAGAIVFYGEPKHIHHIGFAVSPTMMISAASGDETILTKDDARIRGAYVKLRPVNYMHDLAAIILPKY